MLALAKETIKGKESPIGKKCNSRSIFLEARVRIKEVSVSYFAPGKGLAFDGASGGKPGWDGHFYVAYLRLCLENVTMHAGVAALVKVGAIIRRLYISRRAFTARVTAVGPEANPTWCLRQQRDSERDRKQEREETNETGKRMGDARKPREKWRRR